MATPKMSRELMQEAVDMTARHNGGQAATASAMGIPRSTLQSRLREANTLGIKPSGGLVDASSTLSLQAEVKRLKAELATAGKHVLDHSAVKRIIQGMVRGAELEEAPAWATKRHSPSSPGVPCLFVSDLHWGEVVHPGQINGKNEYNLKAAHARMDALADSTISLLAIVAQQDLKQYPGIVVVLGGDMISGNIHDELAQSNEMHTMPTVLDLFGKLAGFLKTMADNFGRVFVPCVSGNHGRDTHKIYAKGRNHTSFDWLLYCLLQKHFQTLGDKRVTFLIPEGPDAYFKILNHRYLLTHGDQFRGGDGVIGALGPIIRGDHRKRSRNSQIDMGYDTMLLGHWHQYMHLTRLIVNGSLKGYDEYAYSNNFPFEFPQQALWITHPKHGITFRMPVYVGQQPGTQPKTTWVSVAN